MSENLELVFKMVGFVAALLGIYQISRIFFRGNRIRVTRIDGKAEKKQKTRGEIDPHTGEFTPEWVYALRFIVHAQNDGLRMAPQVKCVYAVDNERPKRSGTSLAPCQNKESIPARQKTDAFVVEFEVQGPLPAPPNLDVHIAGFLIPDNGRICRYDAYYWKNYSGEANCEGSGETLGWIRSDLIRIAASWYKHGMRRFGLWLAKKLQIERSLLESIVS